MPFLQKVDTIIRRLRLLERAKRYWNAAPRHTLTLKCVNFVNFVNFWKEKFHRFRDGICFIYPQQNLFVAFGLF